MSRLWQVDFDELSSRAKRGIQVVARAIGIAFAGKHQDPSLRS